ncbi:MAG: glycosyltransferase [Candidatus Saccharicenans sp.]|uniref:glycosyltransferase n=1 Tax=Candidatus Saccharicenans sp. TaxID=2819258 RepID=UPI00404A45BB
MSSSDKPQVLFIAGSGEFGSGERQILDYLQLSGEKPVAAELIFPAEGRLVEKARAAGLEVRVIKGHDYLTDFQELWRQPLAWVYNLGSFVRTSAVIRKKKVQLVLSLSFINWTGALAARQEGVSHLWMIREVLSGRTNWLNFFWGQWLASRLANDLSVRVLLESSLAAEMFRRKRTREKSLILPPAIDAARFRQQLLEAGPSEQPGEVALFFSGPNLKRIQETIRVIGRVVASDQAESDRPTRVNLFFPGLRKKRRETLEDKIRRETASPGLSLEFPDFDCLPAGWNRFRLAVIFPGFDPLSRIVLEAGLAGVPVIVEQGAASELVIAGRTGFIFEHQDYDQLASELKEILKYPAKGRQMGLAAREHIEKHFDINPWKEKFERIMAEVLYSPEG